MSETKDLKDVIVTKKVEKTKTKAKKKPEPEVKYDVCLFTKKGKKDLELSAQVLCTPENIEAWENDGWRKGSKIR